MPSDVLDLIFRLTGTTLPADHSYALYGAVCRVVPEFHRQTSLGIHPINGRLAGDRKLAVTPATTLRLRLPATLVPAAVPLAGKMIDLDGHRLQIGVPEPRLMTPVPDLYSRLVVIKGFTEPDAFLEAANRQLKALEVTATAELVPVRDRVWQTAEGGTKSRVIRRTVRIRDRSVVGFAVVVRLLSPEASLRLQAAGLGGRRRFGCGLFVPDRCHA
jgi:CRISPR-associated protein Cas6